MLSVFVIPVTVCPTATTCSCQTFQSCTRPPQTLPRGRGSPGALGMSWQVGELIHGNPAMEIHLGFYHLFNISSHPVPSARDWEQDDVYVRMRKVSGPHGTGDQLRWPCLSYMLRPWPSLRGWAGKRNPTPFKQVGFMKNKKPFTNYQACQALFKSGVP